MNIDTIRSTIAESVGNPTSGPVAEAIDTMATALDQAINGTTPKAKGKPDTTPTDTTSTPTKADK